MLLDAHNDSDLVYDITREESFKHLKDWMVELDTYSNIEDSIKMVVGNKIDKASDRAASLIALFSCSVR